MRFLCPQRGLRPPMPGRQKLVPVRPLVLLFLLLPPGGAVEDKFCQPRGPWSSLDGACDWCQGDSFLRLTSPPPRTGPKANHHTRPNRASGLSLVRNQNQPSYQSPRPCGDQVLISDPPLTHEAWYLVSFLGNG